MKPIVDRQHGPFNGVVEVSGAKNSATHGLAALPLADKPGDLYDGRLTFGDSKAKRDFTGRTGVSHAVDGVASDLLPEFPAWSSAGVEDHDQPCRTTYLLAAGGAGAARVGAGARPCGREIGSRGHDLHLIVWGAPRCAVKETDSREAVQAFVDCGGIMTRDRLSSGALARQPRARGGMASCGAGT